MRICLIAPIPPYRGGIAKYCYSLAQELEQRHDLLLLSYRRQYPQILYGKKPQLDPEIDRAAVAGEFRHLSFDLDSANPLSWRCAVCRIVEFRADAVILPWWVAYWAPMYRYLQGALQKRGVRVIVLCINVYEHEDSGLKKALTRAVLKRAPRMIVHSEQEKAELLEINPAARVEKHLLPLFHYPCQAKASNERTLNLLFFGFVRAYKGLDTLLHAMALVRDRDVTLTVAGEFWNDKEEYLRLIEELGVGNKVRMVDGYIPDTEMSRYFDAAEVVVLPYKYTKTSGIVATAYGFGKPVLATRVGGFDEVIRDGHTGKLVPPDDAEAFAAGIRWFLEHREVDFRENIARFTAQTMSWASLVDLIERLSIGGSP